MSKPNVEQFGPAITAAQQRGADTPPSRPVLASLHRGRWQVCEGLGTWEQARADNDHALDLARYAGEQPAAWQSLIDLGLPWAAVNYLVAGDYFGQALKLVHSLGDPVTLAHSLSRLGHWLANRG